MLSWCRPDSNLLGCIWMEEGWLIESFAVFVCAVQDAHGRMSVTITAGVACQHVLCFRTFDMPMDAGLMLCCDHHLLLLVLGFGLVCSCVVCGTVWHCQLRYASSTIDATVTGGTSKGQSEVAQLDPKDCCNLVATCAAGALL